ncbi:DoxX family protein [Chitinophaga nivalis]|uniref:DoxX family protein n=1 Tax=Chitinophaga nivalis TaxID=2991709 RepID=A0ABT3ILI0_9BACT|nr:DoxX family protein [Chitinophaga nivalis]MCW3465478.1 DoxX family protein [Chitinophaga nivalis]MCW3484831.1 DoxX family protein [Chitinophaga nivalis]
MTFPKITHYFFMAILTVLFCWTGIVKLQDNPVHWAVFEQAGYSRLFFHLIGAVEIGLALAIWWPFLQKTAWLLMGAIMLGAIGTHIKSHDAAWHYIVPVVVLLILLGIGRYKHN